MIHRDAPRQCAPVLVGLLLVIVPAVSACGGASEDVTDDEVVGTEPTPILPEEPEAPGDEPRGVVGGTEGGTPCTRRAQAMGEQLGATATITGLPPHDEQSEELERVSCEADEADDACLARVERAWRREHDDEGVDFELTGERRRVRAVVIVNGARVERTFGGTDELAAFVRSESDAGKDVEVEQMLAEIDPATRVVAVRRIRTLGPEERRGRAYLMLPGSAAEVSQRLQRAAEQHDIRVEEVAPMGDTLRVTIECQ